MSKGIEGQAGKAGYCDAIFNREPQKQFAGHYERLKYEAGFKAGKESGVVFFGANMPENPAPQARKGLVIW